MKLFHKGGGDLISLIQKCYAPKKARKNQNKDFIKAVWGGNHHFMKSFHKIPLFFNDGFP